MKKRIIYTIFYVIAIFFWWQLLRVNFYIGAIALFITWIIFVCHIVYHIYKVNFFKIDVIGSPVKSPFGRSIITGKKSDNIFEIKTPSGAYFNIHKKFLKPLIF